MYSFMLDYQLGGFSLLFRIIQITLLLTFMVFYIIVNPNPER